MFQHIQTDNMLKNKLIDDLNNSENNSERLNKLLKNLIKIIEQKNLETDELILAYMENIIQKNGKKIIKTIDKGKFLDIEELFFTQTVYNTYVSEYKYGEYRPIFFETTLGGEIVNKDLKENKNVLIFRSEKKN